MPHNAVSLRALAVVVASGCIVVAKPKTQDVNFRIEESTNLGGVLGWDITTRIAADRANVVVTTTRVQSCTRLRSAVYDEIETETTEVLWCGTSSDDLPTVALAIVASVVFWPVTAVTAIVAKRAVADHDDTQTRKMRSLDSIRGTCPVLVANVPVELTLPSGRVLTAMTDSEGRALFAIPDGEPDSGTVITRAADQTRSTAFFKTTAACAGERDEIFSRVIAAPTVDERMQLLRTLPTTCGDSHERTWLLTAMAALEAVALRCESIKTFAGQVRAIDHGLYTTVFASEPDIAQCLDGRAVARVRQTTCIDLRRAQMLGAEQIDDVQERARILTSLPDCDAPRVKPKPTRELVGDAVAAARAGDCATMKRIAAELRARDGGKVHDAKFLNDAAILSCFLGHPPASTAPQPDFRR